MRIGSSLIQNPFALQFQGLTLALPVGMYGGGLPRS